MFYYLNFQDGKVAVRNVRRESVDKIKDAEKNKDIGKDDSKGFQVSQYLQGVRDALDGMYWMDIEYLC